MLLRRAYTVAEFEKLLAGVGFRADGDPDQRNRHGDMGPLRDAYWASRWRSRMAADEFLRHAEVVPLRRTRMRRFYGIRSLRITVGRLRVCLCR